MRTKLPRQQAKQSPKKSELILHLYLQVLQPDRTSPDRVIVDAAADGRLMRQDLSDGSVFTIARNVANLSLVADETRQQVNLELIHRGTVRTVSWNIPTAP